MFFGGISWGYYKIVTQLSCNTSTKSIYCEPSANDSSKQGSADDSSK